MMSKIKFFEKFKNIMEDNLKGNDPICDDGRISCNLCPFNPEYGDGCIPTLIKEFSKYKIRKEKLEAIELI